MVNPPPTPISDDVLDEAQKVAPWITEAFRRLRRGRPEDFKAFFREACHVVELSQTKATLRCHVVASDGNQRPRIGGLAKKLRESILDYSLPRTQVADAIREFERSKSSEAVVALEAKARNLFADVSNSGEGGEVLLYYLAERVLGFPQVLCKMPLKTNPEVHYHGVDGIHASINSETGSLALYWGESKLYQSMAAGIKECLDSIAPFLSEAEGAGSRPERDLQLLRDNLDLNNKQLEKAIQNYLDPNNPSFLKTEMRGICLIGYSEAQYTALFGSNGHSICNEAKAVFGDCQKKLLSGLQDRNIDTFVIETFCIPFPCVDAFREAFRKEIGHGT